MTGISRKAQGYTLSLDTSIYSLEAIKKTAYKFADRSSVILEREGETKVSVIFNFVGNHAKNDPEQLISDFCNELLDQDLREIIKAEAGPLRNLILAHALSGTSLVEGN